MHAKAPNDSDEITAFIIEGTYRLSTISLNDYGFLISARMAQSYLARATDVLESLGSFDRAYLAEVHRLKNVAQSITQDYAQFELFCGECERFDRLKTIGWIEWLSKIAVQAVSRAHLQTSSHHLAYKIRNFHSSLCCVLAERQQHFSC